MPRHSSTKARVQGAKTAGTPAGQLRIIGGRWRGTRLRFPAVQAIRPTPDRVRETLFNWLSPVIAGARCLDLFAGSGALGLEALSRGAAQVVFVDREPAIARYLRETLERLHCDAGQVVVSDALGYLAGAEGQFDIVFLDPPFGANWLARICTVLVERRLVKPGACVYLESEADAGDPSLPAGWVRHRGGYAGKVGYHLARVA